MIDEATKTLVLCLDYANQMAAISAEHQAFYHDNLSVKWKIKLDVLWIWHARNFLNLNLKSRVRKDEGSRRMQDENRWLVVWNNFLVFFVGGDKACLEFVLVDRLVCQSVTGGWNCFWQVYEGSIFVHEQNIFLLFGRWCRNLIFLGKVGVKLNDAKLWVQLFIMFSAELITRIEHIDQRGIKFVIKLIVFLFFGVGKGARFSN